MKTDKRYWFILIIPIAAIIAIAVFLIPGHKHHDWDDDEEEEEELRTERSGFDITEEDIAAIPEGEPPVWGGNSPAIHEEPVPGIVIDARENAFDHPTTVKFRPATTEEHKELSKAICQQLPSHSLLFAFDLDAGIEPMHRAPGNFSVELDLEKLDIPEELWGHLCVCRLDESGIVQQYSRTLSDDGIFRFESSKNCLWAITAMVGTCLANGLTTGLTSKLVWNIIIPVAGAAPYLRRWWSLNSEYGDELVELGVDDHKLGQFTVGFKPSDTDHPYAEKYLKGIRRIQAIQASLKVKARNALDNEHRLEREHSFSLWSNSNAVRDSIRYNALLQSMIDNHDELQKLSMNDTLKTPESIMNICMMIRFAKSYLKNVARVKEPGDLSRFYFGGSTIADDQSGAYKHFLDVCPMIGIDYCSSNGTYIQKGTGKVQVGTEAEDALKITIAHELFHHHQSAYVWFSLFRSKTWDECTATVLERDYAKWLYDQDKLSKRPEELEAYYADTKEKEWLFAPLDNSLIIPTDFNLSVVGTVYRTSGLKLLGEIKDMVEGDRPLNYKEAERMLLETLYPMTPLGIPVYMWRDILGFCNGIGQAVTMSYANCDKGYMLGEFYMYIRDKYKPDARLHDFLMYGTGFTDMLLLSAGWNIANAFKEGFKVGDEFLYRAFEEYCGTVMGEIVKRQKGLMKGDQGKYYRDQAFKPNLPISREQPIVKLQCWERAGMFACRTANFMPADSCDLYNLFLVPHMYNGKENAVKAFILRGDSAYSSTPYYLECDSNGMKSPTSVALLFTDKMKNLDLVVSDYYNAVAFYAPKEKPETEMVSGGVRMKTYELPSDEMMRNNYVTGIAYTVKNNKTGRENTVLKTLVDPDTPVIAIPDWQAGEEADISTYCRWYYQPYANDAAIYYSPKSEEVTANGDAGESAEVVFDQSVRITSMMGDMSLTTVLNMRDAREIGMTEEKRKEINDDYARSFRCDARLCLRKDGTFTLTIPPISGSFDKTFDGETAHLVITTSGATFDGKGEWYGYDPGNPYSRLTVDNADMEGTTVTQRWKVTGHSENSNGNYDITFSASGGTYSMSAEIEDGKCKNLKITFSKCHLKGNASDDGENASIDEDRENLDIIGHSE